MKEVHVDTDFGGDIDDLCAVAMLLKYPNTKIVGITTVSDDKGKRAGYVNEALKLAGVENVPVKAGADVTDGYYTIEFGLPVESDYWPNPVQASPSPTDEALELLKSNIDRGVLIVGIGPYTNLFLLDQKYPGILKRANLFLMGGYIYPVRKGYPQWGNDFDWNIQVDQNSAKYVLENSNPVLVPLTVTVETFLRRSYLENLRLAGELCNLIARQAEAFAKEYENEEKIGKTSVNLPDDIINFQHDALAAAIALGWDDGIEMEDVPLKLEVTNGELVESIDSGNKTFRIVTRIDGEKFSNHWFDILTSH